MNPALGAWRVLLAGVLVSAALWGLGNTLARATLPAIRQAVPWVVPEFLVLDLAPDRERADRVLRLTVTLKHHVVLGGRVVAPDARGRANGSAPLLQGLLGPALAWWVVLAAPLASWRRRLLALGLAAAPALALAVLDPALALGAAVWQLLVDALAPGSFSPLLALAGLLNSGGRLALGLAAGLLAWRLATVLADRCKRRWPPRPGEAPAALPWRSRRRRATTRALLERRS
jgi:hypothetical protein